MCASLNSWLKRPVGNLSRRKTNISPALQRLRKNILARYNIPYHNSKHEIAKRFSIPKPVAYNEDQLQDEPEHILPDYPELYVVENNEREQPQRVRLENISFQSRMNCTQSLSQFFLISNCRKFSSSRSTTRTNRLVHRPWHGPKNEINDTSKLFYQNLLAVVWFTAVL